MTESKICDCGMLIKGISPKQLETNLKSHKRGNKHKDIIKFKEGDKK